MPSDLEVARDVRNFLDAVAQDPGALTASVNGDRAYSEYMFRELVHAHPGAQRRFGTAVLRTITLKKRENNWCRWCQAIMDARAHDEPQPKLTDANRALLGNPCTTCLQKLAKAAPLIEQRANANAATLTASVPFKPQHLYGCAVCYQARPSNRTALVASGHVEVLALAQVPHRRVLAPTGVVRPVVPSGRRR